MASRVAFSRRQPGLAEIAGHHRDLESSLRLYFSSDSPSYLVRFAGYTESEVSEELRKRLDEVDLTSCLAVLASIEAAFRIDYLRRSDRRGKDPTSRAFRKIHKTKQQWASLEDDIFRAWVENFSGSRAIISELRGAFKFRHWLAHGRYWTPKLGRRYDFDDIFALADLTLHTFPLDESGN
jgi:hypothetical protein